MATDLTQLPIDPRACAIGREQQGLVTRAQLTEAGIGARTVHRRLAAGIWREPDPGLIDLRTHQRSWPQRLWRARLLAGHDDAVASHRTAAHVHGWLDVAAPSTIDLIVPRERRRAVRGARLHRVRHLDGTEVCRIGAVPVTSPARTLLDLAEVLAEDRLQLLAWDGARRHHELPEQLAAVLVAHPRRAGTPALRRIAAGLRPDLAAAESPLEVLGLFELGRLRMAPPALQHTVRDHDGRFVARVDAAWPALRIAVEFDGASHHDTPAARARDAARLARLQALGWTVVVLRHADLQAPDSSAAIRQLRTLLAAVAGR